MFFTHTPDNRQDCPPSRIWPTEEGAFFSCLSMAIFLHAQYNMGVSMSIAILLHSQVHGYKVFGMLCLRVL